MNKHRNPNCSCFCCKKPIYRRPKQIKQHKVFCSHTCYADHNRLAEKECKYCNQDFSPVHSSQIYCSKKCATSVKRGSYKLGPTELVGCRTRVARNLKLLKLTFDFKNCMVDGCNYSKTYDIHRLIEGKNGGKYVIGNMFAICPNHHAEAHRHILQFTKINDYQLKAVYKEET